MRNVKIEVDGNAVILVFFSVLLLISGCTKQSSVSARDKLGAEHEVDDLFMPYKYKSAPTTSLEINRYAG